MKERIKDENPLKNDEWNIGHEESGIIDRDVADMIGTLDQPYCIDSNQTMKMLEPQRQPMTLNELREKNPQLAVDYIYQRKQKWKTAAIRLNNRVKELLVEVQTMKNSFVLNEEAINKKEREVKHWKRKHRQEVDMKKWWRNAFAVSAGITAITMVAMMFMTTMSKNTQQFIPRVPVSGIVQNTPSRVLSSVLIYNGDVQGSGTVISQGEKYAAVLTAAHNFKGKIGGEFWLYYPDGTFTKGTLIAHDAKRDLALTKVDSETILGHSYVPKEMPSSSMFTCVGYSNGQGPNMNELSYNSTFKNSADKYMWDITLTDGKIWNGASGGGVFLGDACIGVTSERDSVVYMPQSGQYVQSPRLYAVCHQELVNFLNEQKEALKDCGDWSIAPEESYGNEENSPPLWTPNPNIPINLPSNNLVALREDVEELKKAVFGESPQRVKLENVPEKTTIDDGPSTPLPPDYFSDEDDGLKRPSDIPDSE